MAKHQKDAGALIQGLQARFEANMARHVDMVWADVATRLHKAPKALLALQQMEATGGEPDVIGQDKVSGQVLFCDCASESPTGRRSTCYDGQARLARKEHRPESSAVEMAEAMGIELLTEAMYRQLQTLGEFDLKTSSWIATPSDVRAQGGALFCDRRYGQVFTYHNGVQSYYAARGFRGLLRV